MTRLHRVESPAEVAAHVEARIAEVLQHKLAPVIAIPTGLTPLPLYERLVESQQSGRLNLRAVTWFALDEFLGTEVPREATFRHFLVSRFLEAAGLPTASLHSLRGDAPDWQGESTRYEQSILHAGGLDLALLGIGGNGHIAFNEPGTPFSSRTGRRPLTQRTREANAYLFPDGEPPHYGLTMGIGTVLEARRVVLMASGPGKAEIIAHWMASPRTEALPATALKGHPDAEIVVDSQAASLLDG